MVIGADGNSYNRYLDSSAWYTGIMMTQWMRRELRNWPP